MTQKPRILIGGAECYVDIAYDPKKRIIRIVGGANHDIYYTGEIFYSIDQFLQKLGVDIKELKEPVLTIAEETEVLALKEPTLQTCGIQDAQGSRCVLADDHLGVCFRLSPIEEAKMEAASEEANRMVYCQEWLEHEFGVRADGYTLHISRAERNRYVDEHLKEWGPGRGGGQFWTDGQLYLVQIEDEEVYQSLLKNKTIHGEGNKAPGPHKVIQEIRT